MTAPCERHQAGEDKVIALPAHGAKGDIEVLEHDPSAIEGMLLIPLPRLSGARKEPIGSYS